MYNKLFTKILDSSVWLEDDRVRIVWVTLMAAMDEDGFCQFASPRNLANRANVPVEDVIRAVKIFQDPDPDSSDPENEGRRLERVPGGYIVLNAVKHREQVTRADVKQKNRQRAKRYRDRFNGNEPDPTVQHSDGFVYYIRSASVVKIGFSKNPWARLKDIKVANPHAELITYEPGSYLLEKERHEQFKEDWQQGEWFNASLRLVAFVADLVATIQSRRNAVVTPSEAYTDTEARAEAGKTLALTSTEVPAGVFELPLIGDQGEWQVSQKLYDELVKAYPGVQVMAELGKMRAWLISNPTNRKTPKGLPRAINSWMSRAQNDAPTRNGGSPRGRQTLGSKAIAEYSGALALLDQMVDSEDQRGRLPENAGGEAGRIVEGVHRQVVAGDIDDNW